MVAGRLGLNRTTAHRYLPSRYRAGLLSASLGPGPLPDQLTALVVGASTQATASAEALEQAARNLSTMITG